MWIWLQSLNMNTHCVELKCLISCQCNKNYVIIWLNSSHSNFAIGVWVKWSKYIPSITSTWSLLQANHSQLGFSKPLLPATHLPRTMPNVPIQTSKEQWKTFTYPLPLPPPLPRRGIRVVLLIIYQNWLMETPQTGNFPPSQSARTPALPPAFS